MDQFEAAKNGNLQWFKDQEVAGNLVDITAIDSTGKYAHDYAALHNHLDLLKYFISTYYVITEILAEDTSALRFAAENGHTEVTEYLLQEYHSIENLIATNNTSTSMRYLAFLGAATHGHLKLVQSVLKTCGRDIDLMLPNTSLFRALATTNQLLVFKFLNDETNLTADISTEYAAMCDIVTANGYFNFLKYLIDRRDRISATLDFDRLLQLAAQNGHLKIVKYLIEDSGQNADITADNNLAVLYAAKNGHRNVVKYLIEDSGQDIDVTADDNSLLRVAVLRDQLEVVKYLIEECAQDIDVSKCTTLQTDFHSSDAQTATVKYLQPISKCIEVLGFSKYCMLRHTNTTDLQTQTPCVKQTTPNAALIQHLCLIPLSVLKQLSVSPTGSDQLVAFITNQLQASSTLKTSVAQL